MMTPWVKRSAPRPGRWSGSGTTSGYLPNSSARCFSRLGMAGRIAFVLDELEIGGTQRQVHLMAKGLAARGWRVQVVCLQPILAMASEFRATGIPVVGIFKRRQIDLRLLWNLRQHLRAHRVEIVHAF